MKYAFELSEIHPHFSLNMQRALEYNILIYNAIIILINIKLYYTRYVCQFYLVNIKQINKL